MLYYFISYHVVILLIRNLIVCMYVCMHVCMYVCMYVCIDVCICVYVCMYVYIYIYTYTNIHEQIHYIYIYTYDQALRDGLHEPGGQELAQQREACFEFGSFVCTQLFYYVYFFMVFVFYVMFLCLCLSYMFGVLCYVNGIIMACFMMFTFNTFSLSLSVRAVMAVVGQLLGRPKSGLQDACNYYCYPIYIYISNYFKVI